MRETALLEESRRPVRKRLAQAVRVVAGARATQLVLLAATAFALSHWIDSLWTQQEDAYITYQYARRLAAGYGFTFSPGALPTYGTTSPLWTLILAGAARLGAPPHLAAPWVTSVLHAAGAVLLYLACEQLGRPRAGLVVGLMWATALAVFFRTGGMETALFVALLASAVLLLLRGASWGLGVVTGALVLTRPDGVLLALALILAASYPVRREGRRGLKALTGAGAVYLPWALYARHAFGDVLPLSLRAKALGNLPYSVSAHAFVAQFAPGPVGGAVLILMVALLLYGAYRLQRERPAWRILILWIPGYYLALWLGRAPEFAWYYVPPLWLCLLLVGVGGADLEELNLRVGRKTPRGGAQKRRGAKSSRRRAAPQPAPSRHLVTWAGAGVLLAGWWISGGRATAELRTPNPMRNLHRDYGLLLKRLAGPADLIAAPEVGTLAYYSDRRILDLYALTSKEMLPLLRTARPAEAAIEKFQPAFVMTYEPQGRWSRGYEIIESRPFIWPGSTYRIWKRSAGETPSAREGRR